MTELSEDIYHLLFQNMDHIISLEQVNAKKFHTFQIFTSSALTNSITKSKISKVFNTESYNEYYDVDTLKDEEFHQYIIDHDQSNSKISQIVHTLELFSKTNSKIYEIVNNLKYYKEYKKYYINKKNCQKIFTSIFDYVDCKMTFMTHFHYSLNLNIEYNDINKKNNKKNKKKFNKQIKNTLKLLNIHCLYELNRLICILYDKFDKLQARYEWALYKYTAIAREIYKIMMVIDNTYIMKAISNITSCSVDTICDEKDWYNHEDIKDWIDFY
jgi:hypothetical protein